MAARRPCGHHRVRAEVSRQSGPAAALPIGCRAEQRRSIDVLRRRCTRIYRLSDPGAGTRRAAQAVHRFDVALSSTTHEPAGAKSRARERAIRASPSQDFAFVDALTLPELLSAIASRT